MNKVNIPYIPCGEGGKRYAIHYPLIVGSEGVVENAFPDIKYKFEQKTSF